MRILAGKQGGYRGKATFNPLLITECQLLYFCFVRLCGLQKSDLPVLSVVLILAPGILCEGEKKRHTHNLEIHQKASKVGQHTEKNALESTKDSLKNVM